MFFNLSLLFDDEQRQSISKPNSAMSITKEPNRI